MDDEVVRILVSTDNHLGFAERDPIRCDDSLAAFEEVLCTARKKKVDFILLAGDMFHENKPTRRTLHATMELLRKYCLGDDPVFTAILNDQKDLFKSSFGRVNYEDPFQSICLPVFSIHGNHDDPSREGGSGDSLAALDLLAIGNLINYFGKAERVDDIEITPILIRKGNTSLAIYGLGAVRDERLNRMWNQKKVKFMRLTAEQGREDFFNIFVLHQNRDYGRGKKNCVHESMIPEWMDLVIWGNEHECQPQLTESLVGTYRILQPGSSIASSYSSTESSLCPKHMAFFEIKEKKFRMRPIKYRQVRQFIYRDLSLRDYNHLDANHPKIEEQIKDVLTRKINEMILEGRAAVQELSNDDAGDDEVSTVGVKYTLNNPHKILIRLKVEHDGFPALNQQRFGAGFVSEVANPADMLLFSKKRNPVAHRATEGVLSGRSHCSTSSTEELKQMLADGRVANAEDALSTIKIEDLVKESLLLAGAGAGGKHQHTLGLLAESEMALALESYIMKKQCNAILDVVTESLARTQKALRLDNRADDRAAIIKAALRVKELAEGDNNTKVIITTDKSATNVNDDNNSINTSNKKNTANGSVRKPPPSSSNNNRTAGADKRNTTITGGGAGKSYIDEEEEDEEFDFGENDALMVPLSAAAKHGIDNNLLYIGDNQEEDALDNYSEVADDGNDGGNGSKRKGRKPASSSARKGAASSKTKALPKAKQLSIIDSASGRATTSRRAATAKVTNYNYEEQNSDNDNLSNDDDKYASKSDMEDDDEAEEISEDERIRKPVRGTKTSSYTNKKNSRVVTSNNTLPASRTKPANAAAASTKTPAALSHSNNKNNNNKKNIHDSDRMLIGKDNSGSKTNNSKSNSSKMIVVDLSDEEDNIIDDDDGFIATSTKGRTATQQSLFNSSSSSSITKKRQLPLSFSQVSSSGIQSQNIKKLPGNNKALTSGWDD